MSDYHSLYAVTATLKPETRKAFYQAIAAKGHIAQGTWDGCAFNAAAIEVHKVDARGAYVVSKVFGENESKINRFITEWDAFPKENATQVLKQILEHIGFDNAATYAPNAAPYVKKPTRIVRKRVFTSYETALFEELQATAPAAMESSPVVQQAFELLNV